MANALRVLVVEDEKDAVTLMVRMLERSDLTVVHRHVDTAPAYRAALEEEDWHVVLADYALPHFSALEALRILQESGRDIPFIVVSGRIGEETAAELMRAGADDYINKVNLSRLLPAVQRAVTEARERQERRAAEAVNIKYDQNLRHVVRENVDGMLVLGENGDILFANRAVEELLGRKQVEFLGAEFGTPAVTRQTVEIQLVRRDGETVFVDMRATAIEWESHPAILLSVRDVTERKEAEERLRSLNRSLAVLSDSNRMLVRAQSQQELLDGVCDVVVREGGYRLAWVALAEEGGEEGFRPAAWAGHDAGYLEAIRTHCWKKGPNLCPVVEAFRTGETAICQDVAASMTDDWWRETALQHGYRALIALPLTQDDTIIGVLSIYAGEINAFDPEEIALLEELANDLAYGITSLREREERAAAETALRASEERFRKALMYAPVNTIIHAEDGEIVFINEAWLRRTGYSAEDIPTLKDWTQKAYGTRAAEIDQILRDLYANYEPATLGEYAVFTKAGDRRQWFFTDAPLGRLPDGRRAIITMAMDVTEQRATQARLQETEQQLLQLQRLESIGRLAGGVAHDFNNMLHAMGGYIEFAMDETEPGTNLHNDIAAVRQLIKRASALTQQLLAFSRRQTLQPEVIDLNEEIEESLRLLSRLIGEDIELDFRPAESLANIYADPGQMYQIIMNLAVNARDAMPTGGRLTIETSNHTLDESYALQHAGAEPGEYVVLTLSDTGAGMDAHTRQNLFEPFFTTKEAGRGTGLGLSTVYGIVKQHGGTIWVYSEPGQGTTFKIYLPQTGREAAAEDEAPAAVVDSNGGGTILVAEDEAPVRYILTRILKHHGYQVIVAENAEEALAAVEEHGESIALLITDVVMPDKSGNELYHEIHERWPGIRVLFMSGYTDDTVFQHGLVDKGVPFIQKPFGAKKLIGAVRKALAE